MSEKTPVKIKLSNSSPSIKTILVVDDDPEIRFLLCDTLQKAQYNVLSATSATTALEMIPGNSIDCLITDIAMPDMNGLEFMKAIKEQKQQQFKLVVISGYASLFERDPAIQLADLVLEKPVMLDEFLKDIAALLK